MTSTTRREIPHTRCSNDRVQSVQSFLCVLRVFDINPSRWQRLRISTARPTNVPFPVSRSPLAQERDITDWTTAASKRGGFNEQTGELTDGAPMEA